MSCQNYRPLPNSVTVDKSSIEGLGLFATEDIPNGSYLGISHVTDGSGNFMHNLIRTPLGGFLNHSEEPNCRIIRNKDYHVLVADKDINEGQELTVDYRVSECGKTYSFIQGDD